MATISWYETLEGKLAMCLAVLLVIVAVFIGRNHLSTQSGRNIDAQMTPTGHYNTPEPSRKVHEIPKLHAEDWLPPTGQPPLEPVKSEETESSNTPTQQSSQPKNKSTPKPTNNKQSGGTNHPRMKLDKSVQNLLLR